MTSIPPTHEGVKTPPRVTAEADGFLAECACGWVRWTPEQADTRKGATAHAKVCKGPRVRAQDAPKVQSPRVRGRR